MIDRETRLAELHRDRPRSAAVRWSVWGLAGLAGYAWIWGFASGEVSVTDTFSERRLANLDRFADDIRPYPLRGKDWDWGTAFEWAKELITKPDMGWDAGMLTLAISVAAIVLAGIGAVMLCLPAARNVARHDPFLPNPRRATRGVRLAWKALVTATRGLMVFARAIPEYIWAFLFIKMLGVTAWPAVLALALHNAGILGKLQAEVVENVEPSAPAALRALGATRLQVASSALLPITLPRFLLFFFYRWETCVREATVLGMLGVVSLGSLIQDARAGQRLDDMFFFVLLGSLLVVVGDGCSVIARGLVRRAS